MILDLAKIRKENTEWLQAKIKGQDGIIDTLEYFKKKILAALWPEPKIRLHDAKKAMADFRKISNKPEIPKFAVKHKSRTCHASYSNSNGQTLLLSNRNSWEAADDHGKGISEHYCSESGKKAAMRNARLKNKLIAFCIRHFDGYKPKITL